MFIKNFGLFWEADEIEWNPGKGTKGAFRLIGRRGSNRPGLRLADFRYQKGIYILYNNYGPYYTGVTKEQGLGKRLKDHLTDEHGGKWGRFSWFGFRSILAGRDDDSFCKLKNMADIAMGNPVKIISDVEALLIRAMGLYNIKKTNFTNANEWFQVKLDEIEYYISKFE